MRIGGILETHHLSTLDANATPRHAPERDLSRTVGRSTFHSEMATSVRVITLVFFPCRAEITPDQSQSDSRQRNTSENYRT